jgi:Tfp pilus assembly protein PilO
MKSSDRTLVIILPLIALVVAYWMLVLSPKRQEATKIEEDVAALEAEVAQAEQTADVAEEARANFDEDYQKVVTLGKAVPEDDDTASLISQISGVAEDARVDFRSLLLADGDEEAAPPPEAPAPAGRHPPPKSPSTPRLLPPRLRPRPPPRPYRSEQPSVPPAFR